MGRPRKEWDEDKVYDDGRGAYLSAVLGLDKVKKDHSNIKTDAQRKAEFGKKLDEQFKVFKKQERKKWNFKFEDFTINDDFSITHKDWRGTCINGGKSKAEAEEIIRHYIIETQKPLFERNFSFVHLV